MTVTAPPLGRLERYLLIAGILVQQAAFIPVPEALLGIEGEMDALGNSVDPGSSHPLNFAAMVGCLGIVTVLSLTRLSALLATIKQNPLIIATTALVILSVAWSYDPALTVRRAGTYTIGVWLALYIVARCDFETIVRLLAASTVLPAVCSLVYLIVAPSLAQMQGVGVQGNLRGVYSHKNQLAEIMAIGFLLQLYLGMATKRWVWHGALAVLHVVLVLMAKSSTSAMALGLGAGMLLWLQLWRFSRQLGAISGVIGVMLIVFAAAWGVDDPEDFFAVMGRDPTLTGRTELWPALWPYVLERVWLGWGYAAFWQTGNEAAMRVWSVVSWPPPHSHNGLLEVMVDFGIVGVMLALLMLGRFALHAARVTALDPGRESQFYWCILALTLFANLVEVTLLRGQTFAWFTFLVFYATNGAFRRAAPAAAPAPPSGILARAKPLARPAAGGGAAQ